MISVQVNGERQACPPDLLLPGLLTQLKLNPRLIAIEYHIPREERW